MDTSIFRYVLEVEKYRNITQAAKPVSYTHLTLPTN